MTDIAFRASLAGVPVNGLADDPEITIQRLDTGAEVVADTAMTDQATRGLYTFAFTGTAGLRYGFLIDADPNATGQVDVRYWEGAFDREVFDLWRARGLDPNQAKTTTEVTADSDYDEDIGDIHIDQVKAGAVITTTRTP